MHQYVDSPPEAHLASNDNRCSPFQTPGIRIEPLLNQCVIDDPARIGVDPCPVQQRRGCSEDRHRMDPEARGPAHGGMDLPEKDLKKLLEVNKEDWLEEAEGIEAFLDIFGPWIHLELRAQHEGLLRRLDILG